MMFKPESEIIASPGLRLLDFSNSLSVKRKRLLELGLDLGLLRAGQVVGHEALQLRVPGQGRI